MQPQVAVAKSFLESFSKLPGTEQKRARELIEKFQEDPERSGLNFERLNAAKDDKIRSVRVSQAYRAIVVHPPKGDVYLYVWVDKHDDAYDWAMNKRFDVNPKSGVLQYYDTAAVEDVTPSLGKQAEDYQQRLFDDHDDEELLLAGIPQPLLTSVRELITEADLDALAPHLPEDASEMLFLLAAGYSLMEAIEEADRAKKAVDEVDLEDFSTALNQDGSQRAFKIVEGEDELEEMLNAPLEQWRVFLHPTQRRLVRMKSKGPVRVLGGAGTGKTVVLMHRAKHLLDNVFTSDTDRILVTTYTRNLALDLEENIKTLCGRDAGRLDIINLHGWAKRFMASQGHSFNLINEFQKKRKLMQDAVNQADSLEQDLAFYLEEWDHIVQNNDVISRDGYLTVRRVGRGTPLSRKQRSKVWEVFDLYREMLDGEHKAEWGDLIRETRLFIEKQGVRLPYRAVLSDEVQDFTAGDLRLLRAIAPDGPDTLFVVGDGHQRIYGTPVVLGRCGIEIRGRSRRLKVNYRTTEQIGLHAIAILEGREIDDLDGGIDSLKGYSALRSGPTPEVECFSSEADEADFVADTVRRWIDEGVPAESICISSRTHSQIDERYAQILGNAGIEWVKVEKDPAAESIMPGVRLATMHRMKGLEFSRVLLAGIQAGKMPLEAGDYADHASLEDHELRERCLLYVASTRARDALVIAGYGQASPFL